jgi:hypothetical protein
MGASLTENAFIDDKLVNVREGVYTFRIQGTYHRVGTLLSIE